VEGFHAAACQRTVGKAYAAGDVIVGLGKSRREKLRLALYGKLWGQERRHNSRSDQGCLDAAAEELRGVADVPCT